MYLERMKLWNFRLFGSDNEFDLEKPNIQLKFNKGLNVIIGENDSGKSAIIDAIKLVLKTHSYEYLRIKDEDFYNNSERMRIELFIDSFTDEEAKYYTEYLSWTGTGAEAKPYLCLILDSKRNILESKIFPSDIRVGTDEDGALLPSDAKELLKCTYLKPLRDAEQELIPKRNSRLSQILIGHEAFKGLSDDHLLTKKLKILNESIEKYFEGKLVNENELGEFVYEELTEDIRGKELKNEIDRLLHSFYDEGKNSKFGVLQSGLKNLLEKLELTIENVLNPGLGTLNRLFMASELLHLNKKEGLKLALIEELEAHLHPQAQMQVIESMQKEQLHGIQLILTTHSPNIGSKISLENLIVCHKGNLYPLSHDYTKLNKSDYYFLEKFLDTTKANLFFANGIILVEGWAEEILLPAIAKKLGINLTKKKVSIINIGNTAFLRYSRIFQRKDNPILDIPVSVITDLDVKPDEENTIIEGISKKDIKIRDKKAKYDGQKIKTFISPHWTLEYCLSISTSIREIFKEVALSIHPGMDTIDFGNTLKTKLESKSLNKTEIAYLLAKKIEEDSLSAIPTITINEADENINYLIEAIKYASRI